ncbi:hypothetical protein ACLI07_09870 [Providencia huaxiensis]|uniref:hypothetical protein n=1 Tax=Providencia TaxID=586 RepID=UPI000A5037BF|nr:MULTISPECIES: hypothetical protein [Providencia]USR63675.1 hypothetical protein NFC79_13125 [Providencia stuartii]EIL1981189.1 hypothetical protein [Providencia rettgeri]EIU9513465.1 hypothetical protein [Providencia rettgeri]ELR5097113.1 hypothetical protein [Providencia rettgeri]MCB4814798.1 hypothetical protein [Providencia rettgeri]
MLRHEHQKDQEVKITLPDGSHGFVSTDRRCKVSYDFPAHIRIEIQPTQAELQRSKQ